MERQQVVDCIVIQQDKAFRSYLSSESLNEINNGGGLNECPGFMLVDCPERPVDEGVIDGSNPALDILVEMTPGMTINLN